MMRFGVQLLFLLFCCFGHDAEGSVCTERNLVSRTDFNGRTTTFEYDVSNRLLHKVPDASAWPGATPVSFTYTPNGERATMTDATGTTSYQYDTLGRLISTITPQGGLDYTYDVAGNLTSTSSVDSEGNSISYAYDALTSQYDFENRLVHATKPDGTVVETFYNGDGQRVRERVTHGGVTTETTYLIDNLSPSGWPQVVEERVDGTLAVTYLYGHDLIAQDRRVATGGQWDIYFYGYDGHGSVRYLTNVLGEITDTMTYEAFGEQVHAQGVTVNTHLYAGEQYAPALGLYYNRARYLSTNHGRFWNADVFEGFQNDPQSLHRYLYAHADPVNGWDPSGYVSLGEMMGKMKISSVISSISSLSRMGAMRMVGVGVVKMLKISFYALEAYAFITNPSQYVADTIRDGLFQKMLQGKGKMAVRFLGMVKKYLPFIKANAARVGEKVDNVRDGVNYVVRGKGGGAKNATPNLKTVTSWADEGITPDLNPGRWVQLGEGNKFDFWKTGLSGPKGQFTNRFPYLKFEKSKVPFNNKITDNVSPSSLQWPSGWDKWRGVFGQRKLKGGGE